MELTNEQMGAMIRSIRQAHGLTQEEFGEALGVSNSAIVSWEAGKTLPRPEMLTNIIGMRTMPLNADEVRLIESYRTGKFSSVMQVVTELFDK